jgi:hypothetical protein
MTMSPRRVPAAQIRAADADRDAALTQLSEHFAAGRLTAEELDERSGRALRARTMGELDELMRDLPRTRVLVPERSPVPMPAHPPLPMPAHPPAPRKPGFWSQLAPLGVAIAFVTSAATIGPPGHHWFPWWTVPAALLLIGKAVRRRHGPAGQ